MRRHTAPPSISGLTGSLAWALLFLLAACGDGGGAPSLAEELEALGLGRHLGITPAEMTVGGEWEEYVYDPAAETAICLRGTPYQVNLHRGTSSNVLLYLEGGGACWSFETCVADPTAKLEAGPAVGVGALQATNPTNPFSDWNVVYASYCDGSVFSGDNVVDYQGNRTYHHGVQNLSAAVTLMAREFPDPALIVVSGSSAGGYGTLTGYSVTRIAYPDTPLLVLNDSGPGLQNPADEQGLEDRIANWGWTESLPPDCDKCRPQVAYLTEWALERDPTLRVAYFSYLQDGVIRSFLQLEAEDFEVLLREVSGDIHSRHPDRFKRFFPAGGGHTVLQLPTFYTLTVGGTTMRDWTSDFLTDGPAWKDLLD